MSSRILSSRKLARKRRLSKELTIPSKRASKAWQAVPALSALVLAAVVFFLLPAAAESEHAYVEINNASLAVSGAPRPQELLDLLGVVARPGSALDLTGDVMRLGGGAPPTEPPPDVTLHDGASLTVSHGDHQLEGIKRILETLPPETVVEGSGPVVYLAQKGAPGEREVFKGLSSGKQAASFTLRAPTNTVIKKTNAAPPGQKIAALTFDDGPGPYTGRVLTALASKHVSATFFVLGSSAASSPEIIRKIRAAGHEIENHTWSHAILTKLSPQDIRKELLRTNQVVGKTRYLRPPYGIYDDRVAAEAAALGMQLVLWTVDTRDWEHPEVASILARVKEETRPGAIILMHDGGKNREATVQAIPKVVDWLLEQGYSLTTVERLFASGVRR
ncbi:MAG: polysaccharide deacetylase family protein [Thermoleophilia bacterium]|nr:polysaccharide deacetylase family protein [Thermoleophilia bacterium]